MANYLKTEAWSSDVAESCCEKMLTSDWWYEPYDKWRKIGSNS